MLDNSDFTRLKLTTKMVKTIQKIQKQCADDIIFEEERLEENNTSGVEDDLVEEDQPEHETNTDPDNIYKSINLDQVSIYSCS